MENEVILQKNIDSIYEEINTLIQQKKSNVKKAVNDAMVSLYWGIGKKLTEEITGENKPEYGKRVVNEISTWLAKEYGSGFDKTAISRMIKFYQEFPDFEKVATLSQQLMWSHFVEILPIQDELKRDFLGLKDTYSEKDLENAILAELEKFILEMGSDFAFMARQKHFVLDGKDYYMDLLFYH